MAPTILTISLILLKSSLALIPTGRDSEVSHAISDIIGDPRDFSIQGNKFSSEQEQILQQFSDVEISRAFASLLIAEDQDPRKGGRAATGSLLMRVLDSNKHLISTPDEMRRLIADERDPRHFYLLVGLGSGICKEHGVDLIPEYFNSLFRDGRVSRKEGEYTPNYADDVSKFSYELIISKLKKENAGYISLESEITSHDQQVDHLANWLIENWPGCEDFTLSDNNIPAILSSVSPKNFRRQKTPQVTEDYQDQEGAFTFSWPIITASIIFLGSLAYWGKSKLAR